MEARAARVLYTAEATVTGGRANGHGRTSDGALGVEGRREHVEVGDTRGNIEVKLIANGREVA